METIISHSIWIMKTKTSKMRALNLEWALIFRIRIILIITSQADSNLNYPKITLSRRQKSKGLIEIMDIWQRKKQKGGKHLRLMLEGHHRDIRVTVWKGLKITNSTSTRGSSIQDLLSINRYKFLLTLITPKQKRNFYQMIISALKRNST